MNKNQSVKNNMILSKEIALTALLTGLAIIFSILSNFFIVPFATWLTIDLSPLFIVSIYMFVKNHPIIYSVTSTIGVSLFTFINVGLAGWVGVLINICSNLTFLFMSIMFLKLFKKLFRNNKLYYLVSISFSCITTTFILTILNGILFTPLYWSYFINPRMISFIEAMNWYNENPSLYLLYIPNYWAGIFGLYISFNIIKFFICSFVLVNVAIVFQKSINVKCEKQFKFKDVIFL